MIHMTDIKIQLDPRLRDMIKRRNAAIIPVGSIEQHGPHLPVSTDSDIVSEVSKRVAKRLNIWLLPTITYGVSAEHAPFFQLSLKNATLRKVLTDLCHSLRENGICTVFLINGHHGNIKAMTGLGKKKAAETGFNVHVFSYWHFMQREFDHAGFAETSLMLAISGNVRMKLAEKGLVTKGMDKKEIERLGRLASKSFPAVTGNGVWGDPTTATKKAGQAMLGEIVRNLQKKCQTCLTDSAL